MPPPSPHGSAKFAGGGRLGTPAPRRRRRRPGSGKLLPDAPEGAQAAARPPGPSPARSGSGHSPRAARPAGLRSPEFTSEALPRAAGSARRARPPVSAGTSPPPAAAGDALETREGRRERGKVRARVDWLGAPPPAPPTAAAERRVAGRAAAGAADATGNECTLAPRLSGGRTSFGLEHPERPGTRK